MKPNKQKSRVMHNTTALSTDCTCSDFPKEARDYLDSFYRLRDVPLDNVKGKIDALRRAHDMEDTIITADGGITDEEMELHALEFYVLTKQGLL